MAIKIKGKLPLKICSVLFVLYGAASLVALLLCLIDRKYVEEYDLSAYFNSSMPVLSVAGAMLVPVLLLIAGLMGHARADRPNSMKPCFFLGLATGVIILFNVLYETFTGDAPNMPEICTYVLDLVLPVLYTFCAWLNWRHKGDDTPKAADADPAPASKSCSFPLDKKLKHAELSSLRAFLLICSVFERRFVTAFQETHATGFPTD